MTQTIFNFTKWNEQHSISITVKYIFSLEAHETLKNIDCMPNTKHVSDNWNRSFIKQTNK